MKIALATDSGNLIAGHEPGSIRIGTRLFTASLVVLPDRVLDWPPDSVAALAAEHFDPLLELRPEVLLLGTGERQAFPPPALYAKLLAAGIGVEVMSTPAACRTYNLLAGDGRRVAAALIL